MLFEIIENRRKQTRQAKQNRSFREMEQSPYYERQCFSLTKALTGKKLPGIIAEYKRKSPSEGIITTTADPAETTIGYIKAGAAALSVLTEGDYFGGSAEHLLQARHLAEVPILRKDFIIDEFQVIETKAMGADVLLLIAACLEKKELKNLYQVARSLGLEVLFEIHEETELNKLPGDELLIGVNNRNLKSMQVDLDTSFSMAEKLSKDFTLVSESGLKSPENVMQLHAVGFSGFLMGTHFMKNEKPAQCAKQLIQTLKKERRCM